MFHDRRWSIQSVESVTELCEKLRRYSWCGCAGFELEGHLWLNDSTSPDAVQEYAVVRRPTPDDDNYRQIESITVSWCNEQQLLGYIQQLHQGQPPVVETTPPEATVVVTRSAAELLQALGVPCGPPGFVVEPRLETPQQHGSCSHCR